MKIFSYFKFLIPIILALFIWQTYQQFMVNKKKPNQSRIYEVKRTSLAQRVIIAGAINPKRSTLITAPYSGYVQKIYVKLGQEVKEGSPLVSISQSLSHNEPVYPLRSPFNGKVVSLPKSEGEYVRQDNNEDYILRVDDLSELYIKATIPEIDRNKIRINQKAQIKVTAILGKTYEGIVQELSEASTAQEKWRGNSKVEYDSLIKISNPDSSLLPGMSAVIEIVTLQKNDILAIPHEFVLKGEKTSKVIMLDGERREVSLGTYNESLTEITKGLHEGDRIQQPNLLNELTQGHP